jgi:hypothetical protein
VENRRYMPLGATAKFRAARFRSLVLGVGPRGLYGVSTNQRRRAVRELGLTGSLGGRRSGPHQRPCWSQRGAIAERMGCSLGELAATSTVSAGFARLAKADAITCSVLRSSFVMSCI